MTTSSTIYGWQERAWRTWSTRRNAAIREAYPETGGNELMVHNWYVCSKDAAISSSASAFVANWWARWYNAKAWFEREYGRAQHRDHVAEGRVGAYMWCVRCQATLGKRIEHYSGPKGERFYRVVAA